MVTLLDIDDTGASVQVVDEADSISFVSRFEVPGSSLAAMVGVRLSKSGLDALMSEVTRIRAERGI